MYKFKGLLFGSKFDVEIIEETPKYYLFRILNNKRFPNGCLFMYKSELNKTFTLTKNI